MNTAKPSGDLSGGDLGKPIDQAPAIAQRPGIMQNASIVIAAIIGAGATLGIETAIPASDAELLGRAQVAHTAMVSDAIDNAPAGVTTSVSDSTRIDVYKPVDVGNGEAQLPPIRLSGDYEIQAGAKVEQALIVDGVIREASALQCAPPNGMVGRVIQYATVHYEPKAVVAGGN